MTESLTREFAVELCQPGAQPPWKGSDEAAGYDLHSIDDAFIKPGMRKAISIGIKAQIPKGFYGRIADRSGLAFKDGLTVLAGVIDSDYRGEWKVILQNHGDSDVWLPAGSRIAQVVLTKIADFPVVVIESADDTERGEGGFGSTGL